MAEARKVDAIHLARLDQQFTVRRADLLPIDSYLDCLHMKEVERKRNNRYRERQRAGIYQSGFDRCPLATARGTACLVFSDVIVSSKIRPNPGFSRPPSESAPDRVLF